MTPGTIQQLRTWERALTAWSPDGGGRHAVFELRTPRTAQARIDLSVFLSSPAELAGLVERAPVGRVWSCLEALAAAWAQDADLGRALAGVWLEFDGPLGDDQLPGAPSVYARVNPMLPRAQVQDAAARIVAGMTAAFASSDGPEAAAARAAAVQHCLPPPARVTYAGLMTARAPSVWRTVVCVPDPRATAATMDALGLHGRGRDDVLGVLALVERHCQVLNLLSDAEAETHDTFGLECGFRDPLAADGAAVLASFAALDPGLHGLLDELGDAWDEPSRCYLSHLKLVADAGGLREVRPYFGRLQLARRHPRTEATHDAR